MIDRIVGFEKGKRIEARKVLSLSEEYLADHFPSFPIMPGVLMLEAMAQAGAWLMRLSEGFAHPVYLLREVRAVRYGSVVRPGDELRIEVHLKGRSGLDATFSGSGEVSGKRAIVGGFALRNLPLAGLRPALSTVEERLRISLEAQCASLMECAPAL